MERKKFGKGEKDEKRGKGKTEKCKNQKDLKI